MCGVVGIYSPDPVNQGLYDALTVLQHRGQDAAGIMTSDGRQVYLRKDNGLVRDVFRTRHMLQLKGNIGIGHNRYPTAGCDSRAEAQPLYVNSPFGIALVHNGNLIDSDALRESLFRQDLRHLNTTSDSELLLNVFAHELRRVLPADSLRPSPDDLFAAAEGVFRRCTGAYAVVLLIVGVGLLALRDPCGIRPLVYGTRREPTGGRSHMVASESVALDVQDYHLHGDVRPGEALFLDLEGNCHRRICCENPRYTPCLFEYVYLARPDSILDGAPVYQTRSEMGRRLGAKLRREWAGEHIDVVIPIPDTSRTAALEVAQALKLPYREGFIKNRYIGRTFIMPGQGERSRSVRYKLNPIVSELVGRTVLLVDDSIVRGTTAKQIIALTRKAGARRVYFASAAPPVRFPNVYGIDMPSRAELLAHDLDADSICRTIGADRLCYQDLDDLIAAVRSIAPQPPDGPEDFDASCFDGRYVTGALSDEYLRDLDRRRRRATSDNEMALDLFDLTEVTENETEAEAAAAVEG